MTATKSKILAALDCVLDDIAEDRLLDILLDAYAAKKAEIERLHSEISRERESIFRDRQHIKEELHRMRSDPLYGTTGEYHFVFPDQAQTSGRKCVVLVEGSRVSLYERQPHSDILAQPIPKV